MELVYNLIAYFDEYELISFLGITTHRLEGTDDEMLTALSARVDEDSLSAVRFLVPDQYKLVSPDGTALPGNTITLNAFKELIRENRAHEVFEEALTIIAAGMQPLVCVTPMYEPTEVSLARFEGHMHPSFFKGD